MRRMHLSELHDHPRFPSGLRNLVTDALEALWEFGNSYKPILGRLYDSLRVSEASEAVVVDLCSGGGGPWLGLARQMEEDYSCCVSVLLTDKYPNSDAINRVKTRVQARRVAKARQQCLPDASSTVNKSDSSKSGVWKIDFVTSPVDAMRVPQDLRGFRTMFSSFHHFDPPEAREILSHAMLSGQGIGLFEAAERGLRTMFVLCFTPVLVCLLTPAMRPFRWSRILWTYILPIVPFVIWFDGWMSCLRAYSLVELREMVAAVEAHSLVPGYTWEVGKATTGLLPITYVLGCPAPQGAPSRRPGGGARSVL